MTDQHLRTLLEETAASVPAPDLASLVLARTRQRRRARSVTVVAAGTALALGTGAAVMLSDVAPRGDRQPSEQAPLPSIATDPTDEADEAYADLLQNVAVADRWTPSRLEGLDWYTSAFPRSLTGSTSGLEEISTAPLPAAVAVLSSTESLTDLVLVGADGERRVVRIEDAVALSGEYDDAGLGYGASLARDGTQLAVLQPGAIVVVDVTTGEERRYEWPGSKQSFDRWHATTQWSPDGSELLVSTFAGYATLALTDGTIEPRPFRSEPGATSYAPDGSVLAYFSTGFPNWLLRRYDGSELVAERQALSYLGLFHSMEAGEGGIAALREVAAYSIPREPRAMSGVIILSQDGDGRALLPMSDDASTLTRTYGYLVGTEVLGWVDEQSVLISFGRRHAQDRQLVIWNFQTGELVRVSEISDDVQIHVAAGLLR